MSYITSKFSYMDGNQGSTELLTYSELYNEKLEQANAEEMALADELTHYLVKEYLEDFKTRIRLKEKLKALVNLAKWVTTHHQEEIFELRRLALNEDHPIMKKALLTVLRSIR